MIEKRDVNSGDQVRFKMPTDSELTKGKVYTVVDTLYDPLYSTPSFAVKGDDSDELSWFLANGLGYELVDYIEVEEINWEDDFGFNGKEYMASTLIKINGEEVDKYATYDGDDVANILKATGIDEDTIVVKRTFVSKK